MLQAGGQLLGQGQDGAVGPLLPCSYQVQGSPHHLLQDGAGARGLRGGVGARAHSIGGRWSRNG